MSNALSFTVQPQATPGPTPVPTPLPRVYLPKVER